MARRPIGRATCALALCLCATRALALIDKPEDPNTKPEATYRYPVAVAPRLTTPPSIDGAVHKAEWSRAAQGLPMVTAYLDKTTTGPHPRSRNVVGRLRRTGPLPGNFTDKDRETTVHPDWAKMGSDPAAVTITDPILKPQVRPRTSVPSQQTIRHGDDHPRGGWLAQARRAGRPLANGGD